MSARNSLRAVLLGSCALFIPSALLAQDAGTPAPLGTIVLETKRDVQTQTSAALTTIDQAEIDDRQAATIAEIISSVPGVTLINGNTPLGSGISIRGFGAGNSYGANQKVMVTIDGATQGSEELYRVGTQLMTDPELFKNVNVLRGTVGSFEYGSGVVGGIVQLETKDASDFTGGEVGAVKFRQGLTFGSNGDGITSSSIIAWQPSEDLEFLASYVLRDQGRQVDGDGDDLGAEGFKTPSWLLKGKYTFGEARDHSVTLSYAHTEMAERDVPFDALSDIAFFGNVDRDVSSDTVALNYAWNPADRDLIDLNVNLSYADQYIQSQGVPAPGNAMLNADNRYQTTKLTVKNTARFQLGNIKNQLRAGIEFIHKNRADVSSSPGGVDDRVAVFAINEMDFGNGFTLTPAMRYESQTIDGTEFGNGKFENDALMGGISARYDWSNGVAVFGSLAYTESLPILDDLLNTGFVWGPEIVNYMTTTEKARTWEIGASYAGMDVFQSGDAFSIKGNLYQTDVWDVTSEAGLNAIGMKGLEVEGAYSLANGIYGEMSANIVKGKSRTTAWSWNDYYKLTPADSLRLAVGKRWGEELDVSWEMFAFKGYDEGDVATKVGGYGVHNVRATYRPQAGVLEGTEIRFGIDNVFDRDYRARLATRDAAGRNVKLSVVKTF